MTLPASDIVDLRLETHHGRVVRCFTERPPSIDAMFRAACEARAQELAVLDGPRRLTYAVLDAAVEGAVRGLSGLGIGAGDRVALLLANRAEFLILVLACARMGAIVVPMGVRQRAPETDFLLNQCEAAALFHEADLAEHLPPSEATPSVRRRIALADDGAAWAAFIAAGKAVDLEPIHEDQPFAILYTSGTTGRPKGAIQTHCGVVHSCLHFTRHLGLRTGERTLLAVPASHVTGLVAILLATIGVGGASLMMREFKARRFLEMAAAEGMTYTLMVPAMYSLCLLAPEFQGFDLSAWRVGGFGGAPMPVSVIGRLADALPALGLFNIYGATETTSPAVIMPPGLTARRPDRIGRAVACCDLAVMDDDGREVAPGESGEIWMAGPHVIPGYWRNPEADTGAFTGGWWRSGDIGSKDANGLVSVFDRK